MASIFYITQVHIEFGALLRLAEECQRIGISRPLIVTDAQIEEMFATVKAALHSVA